MFNENILKGQWKQLKGTLRDKWGELTGDDVTEIDGEQERLVGKIQERYGKTQEEARAEVNEWLGQVRDRA